MTSGGRCFVYAERRMGKTSLLKKALGELPAKQFVPVYIDLWPTDGSASFAAATASALVLASETKVGRLLDLAKHLFSRLRPSVTVTESGDPTIEFGMERQSVSKPDLREVLAAPQRLAEKTGKSVVVVFDEFQQILQYDDDFVERQLRSSIQHHSNVSYLFLGSRKHLLQGMFLDNSRPLYRAAAHYPLGPIATEHWQPFIAAGFRRAKKKIRKSLVRDLCDQTEGHPFYTQHLCHVLWQMTEPGSTAGHETLAAALAELLRRESYAYLTLWDMLTKNEQRLLRGLADSDSPPKPFSSAFTQKYGLRSASNSQRAADSLLRKDVIDRDDTSFTITDRFLQLWIRSASR